MNKRSKIIAILAALAVFVAPYYAMTMGTNRLTAVITTYITLLFALPTYLYLVRRRSTLVALASSAGIVLLAQLIGLHSSFPFGHMINGNSEGQTVFAGIPWEVMIWYPAILFLSYGVSSKLRKSDASVWLRTAVLATIISLVMEPSLAWIGFWHWSIGGFDGVAWVAVVGRFVINFLVVVIIDRLLGKQKLGRLATISGLAIAWYFVWTDFWIGYWGPAILGIAAVAYCVRALTITIPNGKRGKQ